jgi:hypothetical protein
MQRIFFSLNFHTVELQINSLNFLVKIYVARIGENFENPKLLIFQ